jgi:hypothetical protein
VAVITIVFSGSDSGGGNGVGDSYFLSSHQEHGLIFYSSGFLLLLGQISY